MIEVCRLCFQETNDENDLSFRSSVLSQVVSSYYEMRQAIEKEVVGIKKFYGSQKKMPGKTKADILKQIWAELPKHVDTPVAPLDDEMLTQLAKEPAAASPRDGFRGRFSWIFMGFSSIFRAFGAEIAWTCGETAWNLGRIAP